MNPDFLDLLRALLDAEVRFMVVGAYAVGVHGRPGLTVPVIGIDALIANKRAAGRPQDLADVDALERIRSVLGSQT